jgi:hypothetical protein
MYKVYDAKRFSPLQGTREILAWTSLSSRADVYFSYLNPSMLFFSGAGSLVQSTREAGFFLWPFLVLLPAAIVYVLKREVEWFAWLALVALFATPLAASIVDERGAVQRVMSLAPFGAILVAYLVMRVSAGARTWTRWGTWALVATAFVSFARFHADYLGDYRQRSSAYFEQNIGGALETAIVEAKGKGSDAEICLSRGINPLVDWYWKFYVRKNGVEALETRVAYFDTPADVRSRCTASAIVVTEIASCDLVTAIRPQAPRKITELGGSPSFCVF